MTTKIKRILPIVEYIVGLTPKPRKQFLHKLEKNVIKSIIDLLFNVYKSNIAIQPSVVDKLKKYKKYFHDICAQKASYAKRRDQLVKNPVFFKNIFPLLIPQLLLYVIPKNNFNNNNNNKNNNVEPDEKTSQ